MALPNISKKPMAILEIGQIIAIFIMPVKIQVLNPTIGVQKEPIQNILL